MLFRSADNTISEITNRRYAGTSDIDSRTMRIQLAGKVQRRCNSQNSAAGSTDNPNTTLSTTNAVRAAQATRPALSSVGMMEAYDPRIAVEGDGPPLVLVPGMDGTGRLFYRQVPLLARRYRVVTYALRDDAARMDVLLDDLAGVIRATSPEGGPAIVVGESFGGAVALSFGLAYSELVSALVVLNSFPRFLPQLRLRLAIGALRAMPWRTMALVRRLTAFRLHSRFTHHTEIQRFLEVTKDTRREGYLARLKILRTYDVRDRLAELAMPTLFLAAERDHLVPSVRQARAMAACVPRATLAVLPGHGHICLIAPNVDLERMLHEWRPTQ